MHKSLTSVLTNLRGECIQKEQGYRMGWGVWGSLWEAEGNLHNHLHCNICQFFKPFKLHTDACTLWLGAILYQNQSGVDHIISYASRSLSKTKHKYLVHKLEFLALKLAITEQLHKYLYGNTFVIYMDNNPLTCTLTSANWMQQVTVGFASLANYNFTLSYWSGKMNVDVDALSHILREGHDQHIKAVAVHALISQAVKGTTPIEAYSCNIQVTEMLVMQKDPKATSLENWIMATLDQSQDPAIREIQYLISRNKPKACKLYFQDLQIMKQYLRWCSYLVPYKGVLCR